MTTLADSGAGSLRHAIESAAGPRTIVFETAGTIWLESPLVIRASHLTLAGQTAPGDGITLAGRETRIDGADHVIVRYLRFRPGADPAAKGARPPDALGVRNARDVMIDHVSASWSVDEVLSVTHGSDRVTVQWSFVTEALHQAGHPKGDHGYGSLIAGGDISFHHDLFAHNRSRNPRPGGVGTRLSFVNNLIYDPGDRFGYAGADSFVMNYVGNLGVVGPGTGPHTRFLFLGGGQGNRIHQAWNRIQLSTGAGLGGEPATPDHFAGDYRAQPTRFDLPAVPTERAEVAARRVLADAGASLVRDAVDERVVASVRSRRGAHIDSPHEVGGWPELRTAPPVSDRDRDGMGDYWERSHCLDPGDPDDRTADPDSDGYTNLEAYLHALTQRTAR